MLLSTSSLPLQNKSISLPLFNVTNPPPSVVSYTLDTVNKLNDMTVIFSESMDRTFNLSNAMNLSISGTESNVAFSFIPSWINDTNMMINITALNIYNSDDENITVILDTSQFISSL